MSLRSRTARCRSHNGRHHKHPTRITFVQTYSVWAQGRRHYFFQRIGVPL